MIGHPRAQPNMLQQIAQQLNLSTQATQNNHPHIQLTQNTQLTQPNQTLTITTQNDHNNTTTKILKKHHIRTTGKSWTIPTNTQTTEIYWPDPNPKANLIAALKEIQCSNK